MDLGEGVGTKLLLRLLSRYVIFLLPQLRLGKADLLA